MLSGERFNRKLKGRHTSRKMQPETKAAQRQPMEVTPIARNGEINAPPTGTAALTTVMARARWRMNQLLATTIGEWLKANAKDADTRETLALEVATALGIPVGTVRSRLHRARARIRAALGGDDPTSVREESLP